MCADHHLDLLGITDEDCWDYGEALKEIMAEKRLSTLKFVRPMNLLGILSIEATNRETYLATVDICRAELEARFGSSEEAINAAIHDDRDTSLTYCGMVKFLQSEMETTPSFVGMKNIAKRRVIKATARRMMQRSEAFTLAIRTLRPKDVRLSMHPSFGTSKLSFPLVPTADGNFQKSPWHSCVAVGVDGGYRCVHSEEVKETHDLIYQNGRPWFYRERVSSF